jgi:hypothetical protein
MDWSPSFATHTSVPSLAIEFGASCRAAAASAVMADLNALPPTQ